MLHIDINKLRNKSLHIATPMYGGQCSGTYTSSLCLLMKLCHKIGLEIDFTLLYNESLITRARNYCVDKFLRTKATNLMFIDSDIGFNPNDVIALMYLQTINPSYDIIGGAYASKSINFKNILAAAKSGIADDNPEILEDFVGNFVYNPIKEPGRSNEVNLNSPAEVAELGTGFMMIKRQTFETYLNRYPEIMYNPDHILSKEFNGSRKIAQYFQAEIDRFNPTKLYEDTLKKLAAGETLDIDKVLEEAKAKQETSSDRYLSEDYLFCHNARKAGMKVWLCPWMRLRHLGSYGFSGKMEAMNIVNKRIKEAEHFKKMAVSASAVNNQAMSESQKAGIPAE